MALVFEELKITRDDQNLLFCLRTDNESAKASALAEWSPDDWNGLINRSIRHSVTPYLYHRLKAVRPEVVHPPEIDQRLKEAYLQSASRNVRLFHELGKALAAMKEKGVPVIVLKGGHLAELVYASIALRPMGDVDLLVKKQDLKAAAEVLTRIGYGTDKPYRIETHADVARHLPDFTNKGGLSMEIHQSIITPGTPFNIDIDGLWENAKHARIAGCDTQVLAPEDLLVYLCIHASYQHRFGFGLRALCDIIETLRSMKTRAELEKAVERAREWKAVRCASFTLSVTAGLLGRNLTEAMLSSLGQKEPDPRDVAWAMRQIFEDHDFNFLISDNLARAWYSRGVFGKAAAFYKFVFIPRKVMATMYPAPPGSIRIYWYYLVRIRDVFHRYGRTIWSLLTHSGRTRPGMENADRGNAVERWMTAE